MKKIIFLLLSLFTSLIGDDLNWSKPQVLSSGQRNASNPHVAMDPDGNAIAIWIEEGAVQYAYQAVGSIAWSSPLPLSLSNQASAAMVVVDQKSVATVIWLEADAVLTSSATIFSMKWSSPITLSPGRSSSPALSTNTNGDLVSVWTWSDGISTFIQSSTKRISDSNWSPAETLSEAGADAAKVAVGDEGTVVAVWHNPTAYLIFANTKNLSQENIWTGSTQISNSNQMALYPQIAVSVAGLSEACWFSFTQSGSTFSNVIVQSAELANSSWSSVVNLSDPSICNPASLTLKVRFDGLFNSIRGHENAIILWTGSTDGANFQIYSAVKPSQQSWTTAAPVSNYDPYIYSFDSATNSLGDTYVFYMASSPAGVSIYATETDINAYYKNRWRDTDILSITPINGYSRGASSFDGKSSIFSVAAWQSLNKQSISEIHAVRGQESFFPPPTSLNVTQGTNNLGLFTETYNTISWNSSPAEGIVSYLVKRNGLLIALVPSDVLTFVDHNRSPNEQLTYGVAAIALDGEQSPFLYYTIKPPSK